MKRLFGSKNVQNVFWPSSIESPVHSLLMTQEVSEFNPLRYGLAGGRNPCSFKTKGLASFFQCSTVCRMEHWNRAA